MKSLSLGLLLLVLAVPLLSQQTEKIPPAPDGFKLMTPAEALKMDLKLCRKDLKNSQDWVNENYPKHQQLIRDFDKLQYEYAESSRRLNSVKLLAIAFGSLGFGAGIGLGIGVLWLAIKAIRKARPFSKERKQLFALLVVAAWISVAAVVMSGDAPQHPIAAGVYTLIASLPAVSFGSVLIWWFRNNPKTVL